MFVTNGSGIEWLGAAFTIAFCTASSLKADGYTAGGMGGGTTDWITGGMRGRRVDGCTAGGGEGGRTG